MIRKIGRFKNIASTVRYHRRQQNISQEKLSEGLGYKNAQLISNIERGLQTIPAKKIKGICEALKIADTNEIVNAILDDYEVNIRSKL